MRNQPARTPWHSNQITDEIEPSERGQHVLGTRRNNERRTGKLRCAKPSAPKSRRRRMKPLLHRRKSKADAPTSDSIVLNGSGETGRIFYRLAAQFGNNNAILLLMYPLHLHFPTYRFIAQSDGLGHKRIYSPPARAMSQPTKAAEAPPA